MIKNMVRCAVLLLISQAAVVGVAHSKESDFCTSIYKDELPKAILLDQDGVQVKSFDLGTIDVKEAAGDYVPSRKKFRLITFPKNLALQDACDLGSCMVKKEVKAQCQLTTEYSVDYGIRSVVHEPGEFDREVNIWFSDPSAKSGVGNPALSFEKRIHGLFYRDKLVVKKDASTDKSFSRFLQSDQVSFKLEIVNVGNKGVDLDQWYAPDGQEGLAIKADGCAGKQLAVKKSCTVNVEKVGSRKVAKKNAFVWFNSSKDEKSNYELRIDNIGSDQFIVRIEDK